jgi:predicted Zn-dependent protease
MILIFVFSVSSPPTTLLWTRYFLAQHYSLLNQHQRALELVNAALAHTPSLPDLLTTKARILKRAGDAAGAEEAMRSARELDGQDRFLNGKHAKYLIRVNKVEEAEAVAGLFTRVRS